MLITKEQVHRLYCFLNTLTDDGLEVMGFKFMGGDIIVNIEPIKGEIQNRSWRITPEGEAIDSQSFFYD